MIAQTMPTYGKVRLQNSWKVVWDELKKNPQTFPAVALFLLKG